MGKICITGASGTCGSALWHLPYEKIYLDRRRASDLYGGGYIDVDLTTIDQTALAQILTDCTTVIHLAGSMSHESAWHEVLENNIYATEKLLAAALAANVHKMIFASSNRVLGRYELDHAPAIYDLGHGFKFDRSCVARPDSFYAISKLSCEALGDYYAEQHGLKFYALRLGSIYAEPNDHPYAAADQGVVQQRWTRDSLDYDLKVKRTKGTWLSRRDFAQLIQCCIEYNSARSYEIFFGVSNNPRAWLDLDYTKKVLGYRPQDCAEDFKGRPHQ